MGTPKGDLAQARGVMWADQSVSHGPFLLMHHNRGAGRAEAECQ